MIKTKFFAALLVLTVCAPAKGDSERLDPASPADNIEAWIKLEGDSSGREFFRLSRMVAYGVPEGQFGQRLFQIISIRKQAFRELPDGSFDAKWWACGLYADEKTGEFIDEFTNPYTNETIPLKSICSNISGANYSPETGMTMTASFAMESSIFGRPYVLEWRVVGDTVEINREAFTQWEEKSSGKTKYEMTIDSYTARLSELSDPARTSVDAAYQYTLVTEWMTRLNMGDRPGSMLWRSSSTKHFDISELPADVVAAFKVAFGEDVLDKAIAW